MLEDKLSLQSLIETAQNKNMRFGDLCIELQAAEMGITKEQLLTKMISILEVMESSIEHGLMGEKSKGGLVGGDAKKMRDYIAAEKNVCLVGNLIADTIIMAIAVGEANAGMGKIVAAPTAGSSGVLPAVLFSLAKNNNVARLNLAQALVVAGVIGMVIASRATLSGAEGGCQAECGAAAAMAAGAAVDLLGGSPTEVGHAAAITLKNMLGLVCDPVAGLVEVPCVKRNSGAAVQALAAAQMSLAGIISVIPVDEVIDSMASVGSAMHCSLKETAQGGLAATPTALNWAQKLFGNP